MAEPAGPRVTATPAALFKFCQLDFPLAPGPADGRYLIRGPSDGEQLAVVGVKTLGAKPRPLLGLRGRSRRAANSASDPDDIAITRLTVIAAEPLEDEQEATSWLASVRNRAFADDEIEAALRLANRVVHAHRVAAHDPYESELSRAGAYRIRLGYGTGDQVAESTWAEARVVPTGPDTGPRRPRLDPEPGVAEMLSGRRPAYASDDLLLRARLDINEGRLPQAAIQLHAAARALSAEQPAPDEDGEWSQRAHALEVLALAEELDAKRCTELEQLVETMERAARRRMHGSQTSGS